MQNQVKIINHSNNALPEYATAGSVGVDLRAFIPEKLTIPPFGRVLVPTGIHIQLPSGMEAQLRPRSGLAYKKGIMAVFGTIDEDYTGELKVNLVNLSQEPFEVEPAMRVAQLVFAHYQKITWQEVEKLEETERGESGFGSTGTN